MLGKPCEAFGELDGINFGIYCCLGANGDGRLLRGDQRDRPWLSNLGGCHQLIGDGIQ